MNGHVQPSAAPEPLHELVGGGRRYQVVRKLGAGGMAEVFLCTMFAGDNFSRPVAVKVVREDFAKHAKFCELFAQEARFAAMLLHPNIVNVMDFARDEAGRLFLVMDYIEGVDLQHLTAGRALPPSVAIYLAAEILRGLDFAHRLPFETGMRGIVHRDVSPQNILLSWFGGVKVADFGIAKAITTSGILSGLKGKTSYMSPEQADGKPIDARSDLYSLGVVLWEMLTGRRLFQGPHAKAVLTRVILGDVPPPSSVRPIAHDLEQVVMKLLAKDRDARFQSARDAVAALVTCEDAPRNGPGELVAYLAKRFPPDSQRAVRAPKGTKAAPGAEGAEVTATADLDEAEPAGTTATAHAAGAPPSDTNAHDLENGAASEPSAHGSPLPARAVGALAVAPAAAWLLNPDRFGRSRALSMITVSVILAVVVFALLVIALR